MKTQHTPGPWHVYTMGNYFGINSGSDSGMEPNDRTIVTFGDGDDDLCGVRGDTYEEMKANARLIAAAPDLLETLGKVASHLRGLYGGHDGASEVDIYNVVVKSMDKAKGL